MNWQEIREQYPHCWVVAEAVDAYTEGDNRIVDQLNVVQVFGEAWQPAWEHYKMVHNADKSREYYVLHTDREALDIGVLDNFRRSPA